MDVIYILIPMSIIIGLVLVGLLIWSIKNNQFEDLKGEGERILFDD
jgi:cbb3-type cytochrome oxidase maturation protein